ncbi:DUF2169 family type VI secretion system accessory protein [Neoroseomonas oryzicola]|uniref:DUF2169 domain-containing protein n=1 Tax=Neoroseomonas oryzicola TaxID=535904 RepID=A0A9X9WJ49_9PROT|nr:DUF2169 domain-containing protein [Neoroseomonas oryzicola]MBR0660359.1 DUF2169 domain-containing protein [Neoroseomonas oryzicola]NKE18353.1 DUF2169 domain-containing protein [Neoroseomonas oryzicola]
MKVDKPFALGIMSRPVEFRRRFFLSVAALGFCEMGDSPTLLGEIEMWKFLPEALPPGQVLDLGLPKIGAEFLVAGSAYAPGGQPVRSLEAAVRLGALRRRLAVVGDRHIENGLPTDPMPFTEMPLGWDRSYGGKKYAQNPLGRGIDEAPIPGVGYRVALPNIVLPHGAAPAGRPEPVNFGPIDIAWPQRASLAGTHDQTWLEEDFPGFARDIDFRMAFAAQPEQRFAGFLVGDEDYAITNMHPEEPEIAGRLPGVQPRILVRRRGADALEDVPLSLTTVWFFPAHKRLVTIHHGRVQVAEEDARDITFALLGADLLGAPRSIPEYEAILAARSEPEFGLLATLNDAPLVAPEVLGPNAILEGLRAGMEQEPIQTKRARAREDLARERTRAQLAERGVDIDTLLPPPAPPEKLPAIEDIPAYIKAKWDEFERLKTEAEAKIAKDVAEADAKAVELGQQPAPRSARPSGPPRIDAAQRKMMIDTEVAAAVAAGVDPAEARRRAEDPSTPGQAKELEEAARDGYRQSADMQDPAPPVDAATNAALHARLLDGSRGGPRLDLCGADLAGVDLSGFDLTEAWLDGANLAGANLSGARLTRAVLAHARLDGARFAGADLTEANLGRAVFGGADFSGAVLRGAVLRGADLRGAILRGVDLTDAQLLEARLDGADLSEAIAPDLFIHDASLAGLRAAGAMLDGAIFIKAVLDGADFSDARMTGASFVETRGEGVVFDGAEMVRAVFVKDCALPRARFAGARCTSATLRGVPLDGATFDGAVLDETDFSDCPLQGASFDLVSARSARFTVADLRGARLTRADFAGASLARADVRGTDLSDSSFYEADIARVRSDTQTRYERVQRTRVRFHPRRTPE